MEKSKREKEKRELNKVKSFLKAFPSAKVYVTDGDVIVPLEDYSISPNNDAEIFLKFCVEMEITDKSFLLLKKAVVQLILNEMVNFQKIELKDHITALKEDGQTTLMVKSFSVLI